MLCVHGGMRWAVAAAVALVVSPSSYAQQNPALPGVQMIELDGRAVRVQTIGLEDRRPFERVFGRIRQLGRFPGHDRGHVGGPLDELAESDEITRLVVGHRVR